MNLLKYIFVNFTKRYQNCILLDQKLCRHENTRHIERRQLNNVKLNESIKMHFCFAISNQDCIFHFEKNMPSFHNLQVWSVYFKNETLKIHFLYFRFSRFYQNCILSVFCSFTSYTFTAFRLPKKLLY